MRKVLVVTTRDLPEIPIQNNEGIYNLISSDNLDTYIKKNKEGMPPNIGEYLQHYDENTGKVKTMVAVNLVGYVNQNKNECKIPIMKRVANDSLLIYVTLCLSKEFSGFEDEICHGYIKAIIDDVKNDVNDSESEYYLLAHSMDIVQENNCRGLSRQVSKDELKNNDLKESLKQVNIFCHEDIDGYYKNIIVHLSDKELNMDSIMQVLNA